MYVHMYDGGTESVSGSPRAVKGEDLGSDLSKQEEDLS